MLVFCEFIFTYDSAVFSVLNSILVDTLELQGKISMLAVTYFSQKICKYKRVFSI